ncbi:MAG: hypothetical protein ACYTGP_11495 [Planctomycetota bacterium]|jgi:hypothetical protein
MNIKSRIAALTLCLMVTPAVAFAQEEHMEHGHRGLHGALLHIEHAIEALGDDHAELRRHLEGVAERMRHGMREREHEREREREHARDREREHDRADREHRIARAQIGALELAYEAMRKAERPDAAETLGMAIRVRQMRLHGHEEGLREMQRHAPNRERLRELMDMAEDLYLEWGKVEQARRLGRLTDELFPRRRGERADRRDERREERRGGERERERAHRALELMRTAMRALLEADRHDAAELMELAIHARELALEGARGEARRVAERAPTRAQLIELLQFASELWAEFGHEGKAQAISEFAAEMRRAWEGDRRERPRRDGSEEARRTRQLHQRLEKLQESLDRLQRELEELKRAGR